MTMIRPETEMKNSGVQWLGNIPKEWSVGKVKHEFYATKTIVGDKVNDYERLALTLNGVIKRSKDAGDGLQPEKFDGYQILKEHELVFKLIDLANVSTSRVGLSPYTGIVSPAYIVLHHRKDMNPRYGKYYFLSMWMNEVFNHIGGDGVRSALNAKDLLNIPYLKVSPDEQQAIADYLDKTCSQIDEIIAEAKASIDEYKELKQSVIFEAVTKGLDKNVEMKDSGYDFIGCIPSEWEMCKVRHLGTTQNGISIDGDAFGSGYPFVSYGDVYKNYSLPKTVDKLVQSSKEDRKRYSVEKGDWFFTRTSETIEEVGFSCVCEETIPDAVFAGFLIRVRPFNNRIYMGFAKYYFRSNHLRTFFVKEMNLVTRASLAQGLLKDAPVVVPPYDEQIEIANYLENKCEIIDGVIKDKESIINDLEAYKKSLIYEVVTGKRRVV